MIVLDEQLLGYGVRELIAQWYRGKVIDLTELRPRTHIQDDAVPELLRTVRQPSFVTINANDFWRRMGPDDHFAILCFSLAHEQARQIPYLLRRLFPYIPFEQDEVGSERSFVLAANTSSTTRRPPGRSKPSIGYAKNSLWTVRRPAHYGW